MVGDHACWIDIGPFPWLDQLPSKVNGYQASGESWGRDYAFLVDHFPVEIYENERIVGEIHWEMHMMRPYTWPESVQWIHFAVMMDRVVGHGNGYGRLDLYLIDLYRQSKATGELSDEEAREYLAEMFLKLRGHFFSMGGRDAEGKDATNEVSFVVLEAYDLIGDYNNLGVMWHPDINPAFYDYACDVLARHGESIPVLVNYDIMRDAELRSGIPEEDAWKVVYSGCQWFCIPGKESCDQDCNSINLILPMKRALAGAIERGIDLVAPRGVDYQISSVNILSIPNVADSFHAINKLVFDKQSEDDFFIHVFRTCPIASCSIRIRRLHW